MSSGTSAALMLGLGVAGGAAVWHFTRDKKKKPSGDKPNEAATASPAPATTAPAAPPAAGTSPPRVPGPCSLKLDKSGLTADGESVNVATAVERCKVAGSVELMVMPNAPGAVAVELSNALTAAKLPTAIKK